MSYPRSFPLPRRVALALGVTLIRWARGSAAARRRDDGRAAVTLERTAAPPVAESTAAAAETQREVHPSAEVLREARVADAEARSRAIRQHHVNRQVAAERLQAERRALAWPGHP